MDSQSRVETCGEGGGGPDTGGKATGMSTLRVPQVSLSSDIKAVYLNLIQVPS